MKIWVTGTRGIPDIPGGVETHCEQILPHIAKEGHTVIVAVRAGYTDERPTDHKGIQLVYIKNPKRKSLEAIVHTWKSIWNAYKLKPDILHIHAVGPALLIPWARLLGMHVVFTHHGADYERAKWGRFAKWVLRAGEWAGTRCATEVIGVSDTICKHLRNTYNREIHLIRNGINRIAPPANIDYLNQIKVRPNAFILCAARFVPEKRIHDLIAAYATAEPDIPLVIAGDADHPDPYSNNLKLKASQTPGVILTGYVIGDPLNQLLANTRLFILPSSHEGYPVALLEALSFHRHVIASDIPANKEIGLPHQCYFPVGNVESLANRLRQALSTSAPGYDLSDSLETWEGAAQKTLRIYEDASAKAPRRRSTPSSDENLHA